MAAQTSVTVKEDEIKEMIKTTIQDAIKEEFFKIRLDLTPEVSEKEMADIEKMYKKPEKNSVCSEWIDA